LGEGRFGQYHSGKPQLDSQNASKVQRKSFMKSSHCDLEAFLDIVDASNKSKRVVQSLTLSQA